MSNKIVTISSVIETKLNGIGGLKAVYDYHPSSPTVFPYAVVTWNGYPSARFGDTQRNEREVAFVIALYQERTETGFGNEKSERIIMEVADEITTAFDNDTTLSGTVKMVRPITADVSYEETPVGDTRVATFDVECLTVVDSLT